MVKSILFTSNPNFVPTTLVDVAEFASENDKYYTCLVSESSPLYNVKRGAHILTTKGNHVYILDAEYAGSCAKKQNIVGIASIDYPFGEEKNSMYEDFRPSEVTRVRFTIDGNVCILVDDKFIAISKDNKLTAYPEKLTIKVPAYIMPKAVSNVSKGDIIVHNRQYYKVTDIASDLIEVIGYNGNKETIYAIKDFMFNDNMVEALMVPSVDNPMALATMSDDSMLPFLLMNNKKDVNPMMYLALSKNVNAKDLLLMSMMQKNNSSENIDD